MLCSIIAFCYQKGNFDPFCDCFCVEGFVCGNFKITQALALSLKRFIRIVMRWVCLQ